MKILCWWFGCKPQSEHAPDWSAPPCRRCGGWVDYADLVGDTRHERLKAWLFGWWPRKCKDCGKRFGNHDDCLPF